MQNKHTRIQDHLLITKGEESHCKARNLGNHSNFFAFWNDPARLQLYTYSVVILLVLVTVSFGLYYVLDRYIRFDDISLLEKSMQDYESLILNNPQDIDLRVTLAGIYLESGIYKEAIEQASQVLSISPQNVSLS